MSAWRSKSLSTIPVLAWTLSGAACSSVEAPPVDRPMARRPVTVIELVEHDYLQESRATGSVSLYREEQVGFEVTGRILSVLDEGLEVQGPAFNESGETVRAGDVIASLDSTRYRLQVGAVEARLRAAQRGLDAVRSQLRLAALTLERQKKILEEGAGHQQAVDNAQSAFESTDARLEGGKATIQAIEEELEQAREDLADSTLLAPFSGRITEVHVSQGAVVAAGTAVVTLTLMDPVQIQVQVSPDEERQIQTGDRAIIFPKDPLKNGERVPVHGLVFEKGAVADQRTRTFRIDLLVRNERRHQYQLNPELKGLPVVNEYMPVVRRYLGEAGPLFVHTGTFYQQEGRFYVMRLPGVSFDRSGNRGAFGRHKPQRVEVTPGDEYSTVINWNFRSLRESGDLREGDFLIVSPRLSFLRGVAIGRPVWLLRPGDLVPVQFQLAGAPSGFYVPIGALTLVDGNYAVFIVENDVAKLVPVTVHESYHERRRIEGQGIVAGGRVIVGGVHYVSDGQPVQVSGQWTASR